MCLRCGTLFLKVYSKLAEVFPSQDTASLFVFIEPPRNFIPSQIRDVQLEIQGLKRQNIRAQKEREETGEEREGTRDCAAIPEPEY